MTESEHADTHPNYGLIFGALMVLTVVTVGVSRLDLGTVGNTLLAVAIASVKGLLVAMYFMHLKFERRYFVLAIVLPPFFFALAYIAGVLPDVGFLE